MTNWRLYIRAGSQKFVLSINHLLRGRNKLLIIDADDIFNRYPRNRFLEAVVTAGF